MKKVFVVALVVAIALIGATAAFATVVGSKHDLSTGTEQICIFCHTPHAADVAKGPLWNRNNQTTTFTFYDIQQSNTATATALSTASAACMSCHDGVTAMNNVLNMPGISGGSLADNSTVSGAANIGNFGGNLTNDHPVGIGYDTAKASLRTLTSNNASFIKVNSASSVLGDAGEQVGCESCHDVHAGNGGTAGEFMRVTVDQSAMCLGCHMK